MKCQVCQCDRGQTYQVPEMMLGLREQFVYFECENCGGLQLVDPPHDLKKYYPRDRYYSLADKPAQSNSKPWSPRRLVKKLRDSAVLFDRLGFSGALARHWPNPGLADLAGWFRAANIRGFHDRILDVGCGSGQLLFRLADLGFDALTGVDPFCDNVISTRRLTLCRQPFEEFEAKPFRLVMLHHVLEHLPNQIETLKKVKQLVAEDGYCLIRVPLVSNGPWKRYGIHWAEIDAPRHQFIPTEYSLYQAAMQAGLAIAAIHYEAEPFCYWASELYKRETPLSTVSNWEESFSLEDVRRIKSLAEEDRFPGWAGRAAFFLTHACTMRSQPLRASINH